MRRHRCTATDQTGDAAHRKRSTSAASGDGYERDAGGLWDRSTRTLYLARDRLGIKPLCYAASPHRLLFASQLKAFRALRDWHPTIDEDAVAGFLRFSYIAQPRTIYREAAKLPPGHILTWGAGREPELRPFYVMGEVTRPGEYPYKSGLNVLIAIAVAGGPTYRASRTNVQIQRLGETSMREYPISASVPILPGDVIKVPERYF